MKLRGLRGLIYLGAFFCFLHLPSYGQTRITLGQKPQFHSANQQEWPQSSTRYSKAEEHQYQLLIAEAYQALLKDSALLAEEKFIEATNFLPSHPSNAEAFYQLGQIAELKENYQEASAYYKKSIRQNENLSKSYERRAAMSILLRQYDTALRDYNSYLQLRPNDYRALFYKGYACEQLNRLDDALNIYNKVVANSPEDVSAPMGIARIQSLKGEEHEAMETMNLLIVRHPEDARLFNQRALIEIEHQRLELALYDLDKAIELAPNEQAYKMLRAQVKEQLKSKK